MVLLRIRELNHTHTDRVHLVVLVRVAVQMDDGGYMTGKDESIDCMSPLVG